MTYLNGGVDQPELSKVEEPVIVGREFYEKKHDEGLRLQISNPLTAAFMVALAVGLIAEGFGSTLLAVLAMVSYFVFGLLTPTTSSHNERFADSLYYLGFILTLAALFFAMTPAMNGGAEVTSHSIIEKFGLAIATTFTGMTLRILLIQLRPTAGDFDDDTRESMAKYVQQLNTQVSSTLESLIGFRNAILSNTNKATEEFKQAILVSSSASVDTITRSNEELAANVNRVSERIDMAVKELVGRLGQVEVPTNFLSESIKDMSTSMTDDVFQLKQKLDKAFGGMVDAVNGSVDALDHVKGDMGALQKLISKSNTTLTKASELADRNLTEAERHLNQANTTTQSLETLGNTASHLATQITTLVKALDERAKLFNKDFDEKTFELDSQILRAREETAALSSAVIDSARELKSAIKEVSKDI